MKKDLSQHQWLGETSSYFSVDLQLFLQEQELYQKEGLGVSEVHYVDNQDCIGGCHCQTIFTLLH